MKRGESNDATTTMTTMPMSSSSSSSSISVEETTTRSMGSVAVTIPFLFRGEPIITAMNFSIPIESSTSDYSSSTESSTEGVHAVEETTAARGRALNMSAPEPTNSLHSNITDLSDVSMDDDDKEVEGEITVGQRDFSSAYNDRFDK